MHLTTYTQTQIHAHLWRTATWAKTTARWFALFSGIPDDDGGGAELTGGGYARAQLNASDANYSAPVPGDPQDPEEAFRGSITHNLAPILFASPTADWLTAQWFAVYDDPSAGNMLCWDALAYPVTLKAGARQVMLRIGDFVFVID